MGCGVGDKALDSWDGLLGPTGFPVDHMRASERGPHVIPVRRRRHPFTGPILATLAAYRPQLTKVG
jgi:hypothetical protein